MLRLPNQWDALRANTAGAPLAVQLEALSRIDQPDWSDGLAGIPWDDLDSDLALRNRAERLSAACGRVGGLAGMEHLATAAGIEPPSPKISRIGRVARLTCPRWWRRQLRKTWGMKAESTLRGLGMVHRGQAPYVTDWTARRRAGQRRMAYEALKAALLVSEDGEELALEDVWKGSVANPTKRRKELMARLGGFERIGEQHGHTARLFTLTAPSAFHPVTTRSGKPVPNPRYQGTTPRDAQEWLQKLWGRIRAKLHRLGISPYGFRVVEPHHDGTPHWHVLLWMPREHAHVIRRVIRTYLWSEYSDEPGMRRRRCNTKKIDPQKGSAVGYVAKYIAKNIDGFGVDEDSEAQLDGSEGSERANAWACCHRIRQFQQIGGPPVQLWREIRRIRKTTDSPDLEAIRTVADEGNWAAFIGALGGIEACRKSPLRLWKETTGETSSYGDLRPAQAVGIDYAGCRIRTREKCWRVRWGFRSSASPWTRVNNCTPQHETPHKQQPRNRHQRLEICQAIDRCPAL